MLKLSWINPANEGNYDTVQKTLYFWQFNGYVELIPLMKGITMFWFDFYSRVIAAVVELIPLMKGITIRQLLPSPSNRPHFQLN